MKEFKFVGVFMARMYTIVEGETREEAYQKLITDGPTDDCYGVEEEEPTWIESSGEVYKD